MNNRNIKVSGNQNVTDFYYNPAQSTMKAIYGW